MQPEYRIHLLPLQEYCMIHHGNRYEYLHSKDKETLLERFKEAASASKDIEEIAMDDFSKAFSRRFTDPSGINIRVYNGLGYVYRQNGDFSLISVFSKSKMDDFLFRKREREEKEKIKQEEHGLKKQQAAGENDIRKRIRKYLRKD